MDDNNPEQQFSDAYDLNSPQTSTRLVSISAFLLLAICFIIICFHSYGRWLLHRRSRRPPALHREEGIIIIDPSLLKSLPTFRCSPGDPAASLECAVCLSEFEDGESGRTLPKCGHSFHMECIDMWLYSHSSCPLCRSPVFPAEGPCRSFAVPVSAGSEAEPTGGSQMDHDNQMGGSSSSSLTASGSGGRRKPDELVAITVEA